MFEASNTSASGASIVSLTLVTLPSSMRTSPRERSPIEGSIDMTRPPFNNTRFSLISAILSVAVCPPMNGFLVQRHGCEPFSAASLLGSIGCGELDKFRTR